MNQDLGESWRQKFYPAIRDSLGVDEAADVASRDLLYSLLKHSNSQGKMESIGSKLQRKQAIVFGAGPSIESDIKGLQEFISQNRPVIVAADGAADALLGRRVIADIVASDLDSCSLDTLKLCSKDGYVFVHAHGDNQELVKAIVPQIETNKLGTTQVESRDPVHNFGGFTDGDRACFVACYFNPSRVVIGGMDFGSEEGKFSVNRYISQKNPKRPLKLEWGKKSLEFLIENTPNTEFQNVTKFGVEIIGAPKVLYERIS